jgi:hypothetical protein
MLGCQLLELLKVLLEGVGGARVDQDHGQDSKEQLQEAKRAESEDYQWRLSSHQQQQQQQQHQQQQQASAAAVGSGGHAQEYKEQEQQQQRKVDGSSLPCWKEQVEGLLWAGLYSLKCACDLLQRLSFTMAEAAMFAADNCSEGMKEKQHRIWKCLETGQMLLAAVQEEEAMWAGQSVSAATAGAAGKANLAGQSASVSAATAARAGAAGEAADVPDGGGTIAAEAAPAALAEGTRTMYVGPAQEVQKAAVAPLGTAEEAEVGAAAAAAAPGAGGWAQCDCSDTLAVLMTVKGLAACVQECCESEEYCRELVWSARSPRGLYYSLLEQQGPWFMLQAACHEVIVRRLDWAGHWVDQCCSASNSSSGSTSVLQKAGRQLSSKASSAAVGVDDGVGMLGLLSAAGDLLHEVVAGLPQQLLVEGGALKEVQQKVLGYRGDGAGRACHDGRMSACMETGAEQQNEQQEEVPIWVGQRKYEQFVRLFLLVQSCLRSIPVGFCCNNVECESVSSKSELGQILDGEHSGVCRGCQAACYCSAKCQAEAWPLHREACRALRASRTNPCTL